MTVQWTAKALRRLGAIHDHIAADAPMRAMTFCERLIASTEHLAAHPFLGTLLPENAAYRQLVVQGYRIVYRLARTRVYVMTIVAPGMLVTPARVSRGRR